MAATRATAVRAGRKRSRISYREPSTSEEEHYLTSDASANVSGSPRKRRRQTTRVQQQLQQQQQQQQQHTAHGRGRRAYRDLTSARPSDREASTPPPTHRSRSHGLLSASPEVPTKLRRLQSKSYHLPSSGLESGGEVDENEDSRPEGAGPSRPRRTGRLRAQRSQSSARLRREPAPFYTETNSDDDTGDISDPGRRRTRKQKRRHGPMRTTRASAAKQEARRGQPKGAKRANRKAASTIKVAVLEIDSVIPPWATLPYEVLLQIFTFAGDPLHDDDFNPTASISWLVNTATVCRNFAEPALTALYRSPPMLTIDKPHRLLQLLADTLQDRCINYNVKIRRLEFDAPKTLAYTWTGKGQFEIADLIPFVPQLNELSIVHPQDRPPFRPLSRSGRWHYSQALFTALEVNGIRLKSWNWNSNFRARDQNLFWMGSIHQQDAFQRLEHLSLFNFGPESFAVVINAEDNDEGGRSIKQVLADNLSLLPELKSLSFESCQILDEEFLPLLKENLQHLMIVNCHNLTSDILRDFLLSHGSQLESLILNHNQALDISFLPDLKRACPKLQVLKMDLNYYDSHASFRDSEPKYFDLLKDDEIPSWPTTLQTIEMNHLRQWTSDAAENFFSSLLDSAEQLPDLRRLVLKAILNIGWRDRAGFRDKWIGRLHRVFLRKSPPPNHYLMSGKRFRMWKEKHLPITPKDSPPRGLGRLKHVAVAPRGKKSKALLPTPEKTNNAADNVEDEPADGLGPSRRLRPRRAAPITSAADTSSDSDTSSSSLSEAEEESPPGESLSSGVSFKDWKRAREKFIQGMCEIVDIRIDNLRPREEQFNENDFLDSEASGDEDWNGDDNLPGDEGYAW